MVTAAELPSVVLSETDSKPYEAISAVAEREARDLMVGQPAVAAVGPTGAQKVTVVCGAALGLACGFGPMFFGMVALFMKPIAASFDWGRADVALLPTMGMAGVAIGAPFMGYIADRVGWRKVIACSIFLLSMALLALSMAPPSRLYFAAVGFALGVLGAGTTAAGYLAVLARVFDRRLGTALGFGMLGTGLGGVVAPLLANALIENLGWRLAYAALAVIALLVGTVAHQIIFRALRRIEVAPDSGQTRRTPSGGASMDEGLTLSQALATYQFWLIAVVIFFVSCTMLGGSVHVMFFADERGFSHSLIVKGMAMGGLGLTVARVGAGALLDHVFAPLVGFIAFIMGAIGITVFLYVPSDASTLVLLAFLAKGIATGAEGDLIPFLTRKYLGKKAFGGIYGALFGIATAGGALGPYLYGLAFDRIKSYAPIYEVAGVVCAICGLAILLLGRYQYGRSESHDSVADGL